MRGGGVVRWEEKKGKQGTREWDKMKREEEAEALPEEERNRSFVTRTEQKENQ